MTIFVGCDHAGLDLKLKVMSALPHIEWKDMGTYSADSVDYPDYANKVAQEVLKVSSQENSESHDAKDKGALGLLICSSGQGMAIRANRYSGIRAALCWNEEVATLSREHNNANILCLGARFLSPEQAVKIIEVFIKTPFGGGRHLGRVGKLSGSTEC